ncbi:MAG: 23S rRNA (pseudouridine(1915)-N(3))-methyltransferase RlmH [Paludibacteraceae bacterium]|nr:23S rRNA (pseudouridine(1915)-N(3))-methyltransferase RlmH [Paludibacteraceae bacterium]MBO7315918.1 23S rRNA (pseudouridine(1915)-N(3))-methyltransferase RlmH [Paludibacteraceae bacterium]
MKVELVFVGKTSKNYFQDAIEEYTKRILRYTSFEVRVIPDVKNAKNLSESQLKDLEGNAILKQIETSDFVVLLDDKGKSFTSKEMAFWLEQKQNQSIKKVIFVIGGAYGFSESVYARSNEKISLSKLTFSHQIVRPIFLEQLYRCFSIINGEPYHHE